MALFSGFEGGLATTAAIAAGLLVTTAELTIVITTATISFIVQAFNGAIGKFSSERTTDELDHEDVLHGYKKPVINASLQFSAHVVMGIIVLLPIIYITDQTNAMIVSIAVTLLLLFILGGYKGFVVGKRALPEALQQVGLGAMIIIAGVLAGILLR
jgi:VIT1/CCC1 family predicted Fe2+/Mn2+ transporter